jgi:hypothetical protein
MKQLINLLAILAMTILASSNLRADLLFEAKLDGPQDSTLSTATGFGSVVLNDVLDTVTVDLSWSGLVGGPADAAHVHCCALPGVAGPVLFPLAGIPIVTSGMMPEQIFTITPAQVAQLEAGLMYMDIHDTTFPGGEIRGQLLAATPEPASIGFIVPGLACLAFALCRQRRNIS